MKRFFGRKSRSTLTMVLMVSLALHIVAIVIFGTIKLVGVVLREEPTVFKSTVLDAPPEVKPVEKVDIQQRSKSTQPPQFQKVVVSDVAELSIPDLGINVDVESSSVYPRSSGAISESLEDVRQAANVATVFDKKVEAQRLGVILDVSFSTHGVISHVIEEIQKGFPDALIVFAPGCAIDDRKNELVPISDYEKTAKEYQGGRYVTRKFIERLLGREDFEKIWKRTGRRDNGFVLFSEIKGDNGISGCDVAMRYLADEGADVIYWFADFNDKVDPELADDIVRYLRRKDARLMIHDFVPGLPGGERLETLQMMADRTRGELFLKEF